MPPLLPLRSSICARCQQLACRRRFYSTSPPPLHLDAGHTRLTNRRLISLHGADAPKFLQGLTTNNVHTSRTSGWYSAFLSAPGRVLWDVFIYPTSWSRRYKAWLDGSTGRPRAEGDWSCFIEVDAAEVEACAKHLKRHKLRSKVEIRIVDEEEWGVFASWRDGNAVEKITQEGQNVPPPSSPIVLADPRVPGFGQRVLLSLKEAKSSFGDALQDEDIPPESNLETYTLRRHLSGIAEGQSEIIREHALPQESNIDYMSGIDFRKGCYVGQELTIRTHHTGVVRKRILPVQLYSQDDFVPEELSYKSGASVPPQGANIKKAEGAGRSAGKFLTGIGNVGLALCRLEMMTDVRLTAEAGMYKSGDEFRLAWDGGPDNVRIKAFVPEWHRGKSQIKEPPRRVE